MRSKMTECIIAGLFIGLIIKPLNLSDDTILVIMIAAAFIVPKIVAKAV